MIPARSVILTKRKKRYIQYILFCFFYMIMRVIGLGCPIVMIIFVLRRVYYEVGPIEIVRPFNPGISIQFRVAI